MSLRILYWYTSHFFALCAWRDTGVSSTSQFGCLLDTLSNSQSFQHICSNCKHTKVCFAWIINNHGRFNELCWGSTGGEDARGVAGDDDEYVRGHGGWHAGHCGLGRGHDSAATPARSQVIRLVYRVKAPRSTSSGGVWCSAHRENFS